MEKVVTEVRERRIEAPHPRSDCINAILADDDLMVSVIWTLTALVRDSSRKAYDPDQPRFGKLSRHVQALHAALVERAAAGPPWSDDPRLGRDTLRECPWWRPSSSVGSEAIGSSVICVQTVHRAP